MDWLPKYRKEIMAVAFLLAVCCCMVVAVGRNFIRTKGERRATVAVTEERLFREGYVEVNAHVVVVDPINEHLTVELEFTPHGKFALEDDLLATPLEVEVSSTHHAELFFEAGRRMFPYETTLEFYEGEVKNYPIDKHRALLEILVVDKTSADGHWHSVPTQLNFYDSHHSYYFANRALPESSHGYVGIDIQVQRSTLVIGTVFFWVTMIWGLTIVNLALLVGVVTGKIKADFSLFGYMSGFIVAMYFFREMFPDIPPFLGVFTDYIALFWAVLIAAGVANVVAFKWLHEIFKNEDGLPDSIE